MTGRWTTQAWPALAFMLVAVVGCSQPDRATRAASTPAESKAATGRIRGVVSLQGSMPPSRSEPVTKDTGVCGSNVPVTRIAVGPDRGVAQAFVYLDGIKGSGAAGPRLTTEVKQEACAYGPHTMTVSPGADLEIVNSDPILHNVHAQEMTPDGLRTVFNIAQPVRGQRTRVDAALNTPGIVALTCEAGHPWMTAYILVADHPFVAMTNRSGEFVIDDVPEGTYPLKMWHEGVRLTQILTSLQRYEYEDPYEQTQQVTVIAGQDTVANFALELRPRT
jgi:plastocyanin